MPAPWKTLIIIKKSNAIHHHGTNLATTGVHMNMSMVLKKSIGNVLADGFFLSINGSQKYIS